MLIRDFTVLKNCSKANDIFVTLPSISQNQDAVLRGRRFNAALLVQFSALRIRADSGWPLAQTQLIVPYIRVHQKTITALFYGAVYHRLVAMVQPGANASS